MRRGKVAIPAILGFFLVLSPTAGTDAETLLTLRQVREIRGGGKPTELKESIGLVWTSEGNARIDEYGMSFVLPKDGDVLFLVNHDRKTKEIMRLPASVESTASEWEKAKLSAASMLDSKTAVKRIDSKESWKGEVATVYRATSRSPFVTSEAEIWVVEDLNVDDQPYRRTLRNIFSVDVRRQWMRPILDLEGFIVRMKTRQVFAPHVVLTETTEVVSVEEVASVEGRYSAPAEYLEIPFDTSRWYMVSRGKPLP